MIEPKLESHSVQYNIDLYDMVDLFNATTETVQVEFALKISIQARMHVFGTTIVISMFFGNLDKIISRHRLAI